MRHEPVAWMERSSRSGRSFPVWSPRPGARPRTSPSSFPPSPPATRSVPALVAPATPPAAAAASSPQRPSKRSGRCLLQSGGRLRQQCLSASRPCGGGYARGSLAPPSAPPATAQPSGGAIAVMMAQMELSGRAGTAPPVCSTVHLPSHGARTRDLGRWDSHEVACFASAGAYADASGFVCRQHHRRRRHRQQLVECSRRPADSGGAEEDDHAKLLVCRGWDKFVSGDAGGASAGISGVAAASSPSPGESPLFGGRRDYSLGLRCRAEPESPPPRNMFLTTRHRRGNGALAPPA